MSQGFHNAGKYHNHHGNRFNISLLSDILSVAAENDTVNDDRNLGRDDAKLRLW